MSNFEMYSKRHDISDLVGKKIKEITGLHSESEEVRIYTDCGNEFIFTHFQDCCESVRLNDFEISSSTINGGEIVSAEIVTNECEGDRPSEWTESWTWTFYKINTDKGSLWMRWLGESNSFYSESVDFLWANKPPVN